FARRVASVVEVASPALGSLAELRPTEQFLVTACLSRLPGAVEALEAHAFGLVAAVSSQFSGVLSRDEFVQDVRSRLLTSATDAAPRLALFTGLTSLERWIRIMAVRVGLDTVRSAQRRQTRERALPDVLPQRDPELYWMRQLYTENFERILLRSLSTLPARDRNVLRAQVVHGMSLDEMARVWAVHRATIARWLQAARTGLLVSVREGLQLEAGLSESEVDSVINLIRSGVSEGVIVRGLRSGAG
ncbi:MAG: sigma-70 family RNA polymerase sigma factor, partial [Nannocystaceae bacterium]|nr:sigma-70 family RNA polymerase sigma factor [Nannocystaceae bacterium]